MRVKRFARPRLLSAAAPPVKSSAPWGLAEGRWLLPLERGSCYTGGMRLRASVTVASVLLSLLGACQSFAAAEVLIDLSTQKAWLLCDGALLDESPISSGRDEYPTPNGEFTVLEKNLSHFSNLFGKVIDSRGRTLAQNATGFTPLPRGARFCPTLMKFFIRFDAGNGLHAGRLPGYAASHGCVRLPRAKAEVFFAAMEVGDRIVITGRAPVAGQRTFSGR